ncbi:MAG: hypothetical protein ACRD2C_07710 [Acidimicrobiales bacterium]
MLTRRRAPATAARRQHAEDVAGAEADGALVGEAELRRAIAPAGTLVVGFFDGDEVVAFEHKVVTAYYWPVDAFAEWMRQAGFTEIERRRRRGVAEPGHRPHGAIVAIAR